MSAPTSSARASGASTPAKRSPSPSLRFQAIVARLTKLTSTIGGIEGSFMLVQYSAPIVIALLLALAKLRGRVALARAAKGAAGVAGGAGVRAVAEGWGKLAVSMGETRTLMRLVGLIPLILPSMKLFFPDPIKSLLFSPVAFLQIASLLLYYPLEHAAYLARKGVIPMDAAKANRAALWSVRFWGIYVVAEYFKLHGAYKNLVYRTKQLKRQSVKPVEAEGFELQEKGKAPDSGAVEELAQRKVALQGDWAAWKDQAILNAGYTPLLVNWSVPTGLWTNPLITAAFGTVVAGTKLHRAWRNAA